MKLKISFAKFRPHADTATCVAWDNTETLFSGGDDHQLLSWNVSSTAYTKICDLNEKMYPTDLQFLPRFGESLNKHDDVILLTSADGKFYLITKTGSIERAIDAHKGAILVGQWGHNGASLLTGGEDGLIKVWSKNGMLRSIVASSNIAIYAACWSPDNQAIAYSQGKLVIIKSLSPNLKAVQWRAHEGLITCIAWSPINDLIVSGGEDCRYRVWDSQGRQIFSSSLHNSPITTIAWSPNADLFVIGAYNTIRLCDSLGWSRCLENPDTEYIYKLAWSPDGTQVAAACANGHICFAHVIERCIHYRNYTATVRDRKGISIQDMLNETEEYLEQSERVIQMEMQYGHLVVTTPKQCYIYSTNNWNTPIIFDLKESSLNLLMLCEKYMLLLEKTINLYNYQGKLVASPRWPNMKIEGIRRPHVSISNDTLAVRDSSDQKTVHIVDLSSGKNFADSAVQHTMEILQIALDRSGPTSSRTLAILDKARNLYIISVYSAQKVFLKLGNQIQSFAWNSEQNILAAIQDTRLVVWYCPTAAFSTSLLKLASFYYESPELGKGPRIANFTDDFVAIQRADGTLLNVMISPFPSLLHKYIHKNQWSDALYLCRGADDAALWVCLAVLAMQSGTDQLDTLEEAFAFINQYDKVYYLQQIKALTSRPQQMACTSLLIGSPVNAETILLYNGMVYPAISVNIQMHCWNRALDIALKHKTHIDTVLYKRKQYLEALGKNEANKKFLVLKDSVSLDEDAIKRKMQNETEKHGDIFRCT